MFLLMLISCYHEVDLDEYRDKDGENILTINSLVCPDSSLQVSATKTYFFSDIHNDRTYVKDLDISVKVNEVGRGILEYDKTRNLYISDIKIQSGDRITISTEYSETFVSASDIMPDAASIEGVSVERQGPVSIYTNSDFVFTYGITFTDRPDEDNYYFLQWDAVERGKDIRWENETLPMSLYSSSLPAKSIPHFQDGNHIHHTGFLFLTKGLMVKNTPL